MLGRRVVGPDGRVWRVRRRWLPWQPRIRTGRGFNFDAAGGGADASSAFDLFDGPISIVLGVVAAIVLGVLVAFLFPLIFTLIELLIALVLLPLGVGMRVVLGEPWVLVAHTSGPPPERRFMSVVGWRASREALDQMAGAIRAGHG